MNFLFLIIHSEISQRLSAVLKIYYIKPNLFNFHAFYGLRPLQFNDLYENAGLWDSESRTWEQTFEIDKRQLQRFGMHKIIRFLFSRPRAFETYNLSKFH